MDMIVSAMEKGKIVDEKYKMLHLVSKLKKVSKENSRNYKI